MLSVGWESWTGLEQCSYGQIFTQQVGWLKYEKCCTYNKCAGVIRVYWYRFCFFI